MSSHFRNGFLLNLLRGVARQRNRFGLVPKKREWGQPEEFPGYGEQFPMHERHYAIYEYKDSIMRLEEKKQELEREKIRQRRRAVQATFEQEVLEWRECFTNGTRLSYLFMKNVVSPELLAFLQLDDEEQDDLKH